MVVAAVVDRGSPGRGHRSRLQGLGKEVVAVIADRGRADRGYLSRLQGLE